MRALVVVVMMLAAFLTPTTADAHTSCAYDPDQLTYRQMIRQETTGDNKYPVMFLGKVVRLKDLGGKPRGETIAKLAVAEHPVGFAPLISSVHFYRPPNGGPLIPGQLQFEPRKFYVVIAARRTDGSFDTQLLCGDTRRVSKSKFYSLARFARAQE